MADDDFEDDDFGDFTSPEGPATASSNKEDPNTNGNGQRVTADDSNVTNDFGSFGTAGATTTDIQDDLQPTGTDDFGSFEDAPAIQADPSTADISNSLEKTTDSGNLAINSTDSAVVPGDDHDFLNFDSSPVESSAESNPTNPVMSSVADAFGAFDAAPKGTDAGATAEKNCATVDESPQTSPDVAADDDDFGDFGGADENNKAPAGPADAVPVDDDFGDFGGADESKQTPAAPADVAADDDDFGDFGGADEAKQTPAEPAVAGVDDDDFGDFGGADEAKQTPAQPADAGVDDDDFGDFGGADETKQTPPAPADVVPDDDDFGAFGGADESKQTSAAPADAVTDDDGFGDFDGPSQTPSAAADAVVPSSAPADAVTDDDDDFGDFDGPTAETTPTAPANTVADDDDFGDFGEATETKNTPPTSTDAAVDDDDFGDFDGPTAASKETPSASANAVSDDDDFGDFDHAPAPTPTPVNAAADDDDFGDFDNAVDTTSKQGIVQSTPSAPDPLLAKARTVFGRLFNRFESSEINDGTTNNDAEIHDGVTIASLLSSIKVKSSDETEPAHNVLIKLLGESRGKASEETKESKTPNFIVSDRDRSGVGCGMPDAHFAVPIGGRGTLMKDVLLKKKRKQPGSSHYLPEVLPIQLSPMKSEKSTNSVPAPPTQAATIVSLPPKTDSTAAKNIQTNGNKATTTDSSVSSTNAQQLLQQIPDLSFMLQPKLSLPEIKK